jgi:hypothetical protein
VAPSGIRCYQNSASGVVNYAGFGINTWGLMKFTIPLSKIGQIQHGNGTPVVGASAMAVALGNGITLGASFSGTSLCSNIEVLSFLYIQDVISNENDLRHKQFIYDKYGI